MENCGNCLFRNSCKPKDMSLTCDQYWDCYKPYYLPGYNPYLHGKDKFWELYNAKYKQQGSSLLEPTFNSLSMGMLSDAINFSNDISAMSDSSPTDTSTDYSDSSDSSWSCDGGDFSGGGSSGDF